MFAVSPDEMLIVCPVFPQSGAEDVKRHRWFKNINWEEVYYRKLKASHGP